MDFAGNDFIYLSKIKKEKIKKIKKSEEQNKAEAPIIEEQKLNNEEKNKNKEEIKKDSLELEDSDDDTYLSVDSNSFNIDLENSQLNSPINLMAAPGIKYKKAIDTNVCVIRYNTLEKEPENSVTQLYKCQKCNAFLNKYSILNSLEKDKYEWKCEFCFNINRDLYIEKSNLPRDECIEKCDIKPEILEEENKEDDDTSLIFCLDISGSMSFSYLIDQEIKEKFNKIRGNIFGNSITRLDMVKISIENIINTLLKKSPKVKVGLVTFESEVEVRGDCLSNIIKVRGDDLNNESKLESLGKENTNLIKCEIGKSSNKIIESLREIEDRGSTALGPAVLLSLFLLNKAKIGSRIFVCTDGQSNAGIGSLGWYEKEKANQFYTKIGKIAKEKGIVISLIAFEDCESQINILKNMVEYSGGDIFRVNPKFIIDEVNDFLENKAIASEVEIKMNLNKCMTFRDEEKDDMVNDGSTILKKIGNVTKEKETYIELKFKHAIKLSEIKEINYDELNNLIFQSEIIYKKKNGGKYIRVITKNLKVSDNKEEINKKANLNIISTLQIQKSAKLAGAGRLMDAQAQIHIARNFLNNNINYNNNYQIYNQFNSNMNNFNMSLSNMNMNNNMNNSMNMYMNNNMNNYMNMNMMNMNMNMNNNMNNNMNMNMMNMMNMNYNMNMMNRNMNMNMMNMNMNNNMMNNNLNMMNNNMMNNNMMNNNMMNNNMMNNNMMNNNMMNSNMNMNSDFISGQIHSLSNISESRNNLMYQRNKK